MGVLQQDIEQFFTKRLGSTIVVKRFLDRLNVKETVDSICRKEKYDDLTHGDVFEILVLNRLQSPKPLYEIEEWAKKTIVSDIYKVDPKRLNDDVIGRTLDAVSENLEKIYGEIALNAARKHNIKLDLIYYDVTSIYFEGEMKKCEQAKLGYNRDEKVGKKQINLGLNVSGEGAVPLHYDVYDGNTPDIKTVMKNMQALKSKLKPSKLLIIQDRGTVSKDVLIKIEEDGIRFIVGLARTEKLRDFLLNLDLSKFKEVKKGFKTLDTKYTFGKEYRAIIVYSNKLEDRRRKARNKQLERLEKDLKKINSKLNTGKHKNRDYVKERLVKLSIKHKNVWKYYKPSLESSEGQLSMKYELNKTLLQKDERIDGMYVLITNDYDYTPEEVLERYKGNISIENRVKVLKSTLKIRPIFLHKENRIKALVMITIIALMIYSIIELLCKRKGMKMSARKVLRKFEYLSVGYIKAKHQKDWIIKIQDPWPEEKFLLEILDVDLQSICCVKK
ncbi:MAG: IS1634 family transposase [Candidatus Thermoplasmatota archaeon]|nr:IS1634 family transposase [Candidatus Thermoplasmatota archaeon]